MKFKILILFFLIFQSDWESEIEAKIDLINATGILIDSGKEESREGGRATVELYSSKDGLKISGTYIVNEMNIQYLIFKSNDIVIAEIVSGVEPLIYKTEKKITDPYAVLKEKLIYFKNENEGVQKIRKINLYDTDDINLRKKELREIEFKTSIVNGKKFNEEMERFDIIKKNL